MQDCNKIQYVLVIGNVTYRTLTKLHLQFRVIGIQTRNKSITSKAIQYQQDYRHTNAHYAGGVNNYLNSNQTKYLAQLCGRFFLRFRKFPPQICKSCGATYRRKYETFSAL